ncbi:MAG: T9SS C-terminal target domain-containing protein [Ignavibacteriales bacterium]|nr:MAG: T9SS C-terminal target domain-containing protein [Ignavibacteriales bacterium]
MNSFKRYYGASFIYWVILLLLNFPLRIHSEIHPSSNEDSKNLSTSLVELIAPRDGEIIQSNSLIKIQWKTNNLDGKMSIYYSENDGSNWINIAREINASSNFYEWSVPEISSNKCLIRITTVDQNPNTSSTSGLFSIKNYNTISNRIWDGSIPFLQPFNTTDYYGSGDVDLNGLVDDEDINQINLIIAGQSQQVIRADINGDGLINSDDVTLLNTKLSSGILPGWWNKLSTKEERISWLKKMLAIDKVDEHPYIAGSYECYNFATQLYHNFTGYNEFSSRYFSSQTKFNIPVYYIFINPPSGESHYVNAVLVGDNPLVFTDWAFIEPQTDEIIYPGLGYTSVNTTLYITSLPSTYQVIFRLNQNDNWELQKKDENFIYRRPDLLPSAINNKPFLWHPKAVSDDLIICERNRDDIDRKYDICFIKSENENSNLFSKTYYPDLNTVNNTIVAVQDGGVNRIFLIWEGEVNDERKTFFGCIDKNDFKLKSYQYPDFLQNIFSVKSLLMPENKVAFYWTIGSTLGELNGINWSEIDEDGKLENPTFIKLSNGSSAKFSKFEIVYNVTGDKFIYYSLGTQYHSTLYRMKIDGTNNVPEILEPSGYLPWFIRYDASNNGNLFLVSEWNSLWNRLVCTKLYDNTLNKKVLYRMIKRNTLQYIEIINDAIYFIGNETVNNQIVPVWFTYKNDIVNDYHYLAVGEGCDALNISYIFKNGKVFLVWQEISDKLVTFNFNILDSELTNVSTNSETITDFNLLQNYPNPFNSSTVINYSVPFQSKVTIKIYDILGREVKTLLNEEKPKGEYTARFENSDVEGELSSGIYLCRLTINSLEDGKAFDKSIKLVLIK